MTVHGSQGVGDGRLAYTIDEVAQITTIKRTTLYVAIRNGALPIKKIGRRTIILAADLCAFLDTGGARAA